MNLFKREQIQIPLKIITAVLMSVISGLFIEKFLLYNQPFSKTRFIAFSFIVFIISLAFFMYSYIKNIIEFIIKKRYLIAGIIFILLVLLKLHGSSIGFWDNYLHDKIDAGKNTDILGISRGIRSDEWLVQTPYYLAQVNSKPSFQIHNENIADGQNMLPISGSPIIHPSMLGRPFVWGFILFGGEYGLSWFWWSKLLLLVLLTFELCLIITKNNRLISIVGAVMVAFSPPVQWWFSTPLPDTIIFSFVLIVCAHHFFSSGDRIKRIFLLLGFTFSAAGFMLPTYPAWQIVFGMFALITVLIIIFKNRKNLNFSKYETGAIIIAFLFVLSLGAFFVKDSLQAIITTMNTAYPGKRFVTGGGFDFSRFFSIIYSWLLPFQDTDKITGLVNVCELSLAVSFFPLSIFGFIFVFKKDKKNILIPAFWLFFCLFLLSFMFIKFPSFLAKITLLSNSPVERVAVVFSIIALLLDIYILDFIAKNKPFNYIQSVIISLAFAVLCWASIYGSKLASYIISNGFNIFVVLIIIFILSALYLSGKYKIFSYFIILIVLTTGLVINPVARGLDSIYNKITSQLILEIEKNEPDTKWAAVNSIIYGNLITMLGADSLNSAHNYPNLKLWESIDADKKFTDNYNRFAHIEIRINDNISFENPQADVLIVNLPLSELKKQNVEYLLSKGALNQPDSEIKLELIYEISPNDLYIYRLS